MKLKKILSFVVVVGLCMAMLTSTVFAAGTAKNETVFAALNSDGSVNRIYVVNQLMDDYTDYGTYTDIKNLSTNSVPTVSGDKITFSDKDVEGGLYYQGTMTGELPMTFNISYQLDDKFVSADTLSGAAGHLVITVKASQNALCSEAVRDGLMAQITAKLDTQYAGGISAPGSTVVAVGKTATISYVVLPGEEGTMVIEADVTDFRMDQIAITLLKGTMASGDIKDKLDEYDDGFNDMLDGADDMVDGTTELKDGMESLTDGLGDLNSGLSKLSSGGKELYSGMKEYGDNLSAYMSGVSGIVQPSAEIRTGLDGLAQNGTAIAQGISDVSGEVDALSSSSGDLKVLAQSLESSDDPQVAALAKGMLQTLAALSDLSDGLGEASTDLNTYISGVQQAAEDYGQFDDGVISLSEGGKQLNGAFGDMLIGIKEYTGGVSKSAAGTKKIYNSVRSLPDDIQKLIDGQIDFKDGIATAKEDMSEATDMFVADDDPPVSFASPGKNNPTTVQYILTTPAIAKKEAKTEAEVASEEETAQEDFFTRFAALFN